MAYVYIIYSLSLDRFYIGFTTLEVNDRLQHHLTSYYHNKYTARASDWEIYLEIKCVNNQQAVSVEEHIKSMKSKTYISNLKAYPEMVEKLLKRFCT